MTDQQQQPTVRLIVSRTTNDERRTTNDRCSLFAVTLHRPDDSTAFVLRRFVVDNNDLSRVWLFSSLLFSSPLCFLLALRHSQVSGSRVLGGCQDGVRSRNQVRSSVSEPWWWGDCGSMSMWSCYTAGGSSGGTRWKQGLGHVQTASAPWKRTPSFSVTCPLQLNFQRNDFCRVLHALPVLRIPLKCN